MPPKAPDSQSRMKATPRLAGASRAESAELADSLSSLASLAPVEAPIEERRELLPTASKTDLLFACTWPWGRRVRREPPGDRTRFGSAFHEVMELLLAGPPAGKTRWADVAKKWEVDADELLVRVDAAYPIVEAWLQGDNLWGVTFPPESLRTEVSVAYNVMTGDARYCDNPDEEAHEYLDRLPGEIPGTVDLYAIVGTTLLVLDHKSGWNVAADWQPRTPAENGQLRTLALALLWLHPDVEQIIVAFFHAPASGSAIVMGDELTRADLKAHSKALRQAMGNIGNGWLRDGPWCEYCPAWDLCPTNRNALVELKRGIGPLTREKVGAIHQATATYDQLRDRLRSEIRAWVSTHGEGVRPDGQEVAIIEKEVRNLSQASILRAMGPLKGAKEIDRLEKLGCVEVTTRHELRAVRR